MDPQPDQTPPAVHPFQADPQFARPVGLVPAWLLSLLVHGLLAGLLVWLGVRTAHGLPEKADIEAGIVFKSSDEKTTVFENDEERFERQQDQPPELPRLDAAATDALAVPDQSDRPEELAPLPDLLGGAAPGAATADVADFRPPPALSGGPTRVSFGGTVGVGDSFVWVIDRSASMNHGGAINLAKAQLIDNLATLSDRNRFQVLFYNEDVLRLPGTPDALVLASPSTVESAELEIRQVPTGGGTDHIKPLTKAVRYRPDVIFFLTDAEKMDDDDVRRITALNHSGTPATIHTIEFGIGPAREGRATALRELARSNYGSYVYHDIGDGR